MRYSRYVTGQRLPSDLARGRDFDVVVDAQRLEGLRQALRREVQVHTSLRALAQQIGVARGTLRKFLAMESVPLPGNLERIESWAADRPEVPPPLGAVTLAVLVLDLPAPLRAPTRGRLARELAATYSDAGLPLPDWLGWECPG